MWVLLRRRRYHFHFLRLIWNSCLYLSGKHSNLWGVIHKWGTKTSTFTCALKKKSHFGCLLAECSQVPPNEAVWTNLDMHIKQNIWNFEVTVYLVGVHEPVELVAAGWQVNTVSSPFHAQELDLIWSRLTAISTGRGRWISN